VDYKKPTVSISRAKLVTEIAKGLEEFINVRSAVSPQLLTVYRLHFQEKQSIAIDPAYVGYRVGPGGIELPHIYIASLNQVSIGSWQPFLIWDGEQTTPVP
jgi:hypothetical protein